MSESKKRLATIPIDAITVPEVRASSVLTPEQEAIFKASIERFGVIQPIVVRKVGVRQYELIAGKSRLEEQQEKGAKEVDAIVLEAGDKDALMMHLIENLARGKSDPISEAKVFAKFIESGGTKEEIARIVGRTPEWVRLRLACLKMPEEFQQALQDGRLKIGHVEEATRLPDVQEIDYALRLIRDLSWDVKTAREYVDRRLSEIAVERIRSGTVEPPPLPTPTEAKAMAMYSSCSGCRRRVLRKEMRMPPLCEECYTLLRYVCSQLGEPRKAMSIVYEAVQDWLTRRQQIQPPTPPPTYQPPPEVTPSPPEKPEVTEILPEKPVTGLSDDERLLLKRLLKKLASR